MNHSLTTGINLDLIQELDKTCGDITADPRIKVVVFLLSMSSIDNRKQNNVQ